MILMNFSDFIKDFALKTKNLIASYEEYHNLTGKEKKEKLDTNMTKWATMFIDTVSMNAAFKWVIKKVLIKNIPAITQAIFDLIEAKVKGITSEI